MQQKKSRHVLTRSALLASLVVLTMVPAVRGQTGAPGDAMGSPSGAAGSPAASGSYGGLGATTPGPYGGSGGVMPGSLGSMGTAGGPGGGIGTSAAAPGGPMTGDTPSLNSGVQTGNASAAVSEMLSGTGISPAQAAAIAKSVSPAELNAIAGSMGMTPDQIQALQGAVSNGRVSSSQIDSLSVRLGISGISATQVQSIGRALGLSDAQVAQLQQNLQRIQTGTGMASPQGTLPGSAAPASLLQGTQSSGGYLRAPSVGGSAYYSDLENTYRTMDLVTGQVPEFTGPEELSQFGYDFFSSSGNVANLSASQNVPVNADYVVGPGDQLQLMVWGTRNETDPLPIGRDGAVTIPGIGPVQVAGLHFDEAKEIIKGKVEQITGVHASVTMGQIRTISVFVVGAVASPGPYTLNSLARISNALAAAGGPTKVGSLRRIERKHDNQLVGVVDLYDVLLRGDTAADTRLDDHDVILVPTIGPVIAIAGDVKRPAIFEMSRPKQSLASVLSMTGGISAFASTQRIQVERVESHQRRVVVDARLDSIAIHNFSVSDGDLIKVFPVLPNQKNKVTLLGNVFRPGDYQWHPGLRLSDLITLGEGVQPKTYFRYALIKRLEGKQLYSHYVPVDLSTALDVPRGDADPMLEVFDTVTIYNQDDLRDIPTVTITGEVRIPGTYKLDPNMKLSDLIYLAGGLTDRAYQKNAELARTQVVAGTMTRHTYMDVDLRKALHGQNPENLALRSNDQLYIRSATNWHLPWTITVNGRVARPGVYTVHEGERLSALLQKCGGLLPDAFPEGMVFIRKSIKETEQKQLDQARLELQQEVAQVSLVQAQLAASPGSSSHAAESAGSFATMQQILASSTGMQATGRLVIHFPQGQFDGAQEEFDPIDNPVLEEDDTIDMPRRPSSVSVLGQVYSPTSVLARPGLRVQEYLALAGGPTTLADTKHIMVIKADGEIMTSDGYASAERNRTFPFLPLLSGGLDEATLNVGDTVYVPNRIPDFTKLQVTKDVTTIIAQSVQSLAVLGILAASI